VGALVFEYVNNTDYEYVNNTDFEYVNNTDFKVRGVWARLSAAAAGIWGAPFGTREGVLVHTHRTRSSCHNASA